MKVQAQRACLFSPAGEEEAARFLAECTGLARAVALPIAESPFGFPVPGGERCAAGEALERVRRGEPVVLSHGGLSGVREVSRADLLVRAGGGTRLSEIEAAVREAGLFFPHFDSSCRDDLTLAALLMEAPASPLVGAYGGLRESVLSLRLVTGGGETIHSGSRAVKDVAGYEIIGFVLGCGGRCGMIAEATLRLLPGPRTIVRGVLGGEAAALAAVARGIREHRRVTAAVLFGWRAAGRLAAVFGGALAAGGRPAADTDVRTEAGADAREAAGSRAAMLYFEIHAPAPGAEQEIRAEIAALAGSAGATFAASAQGSIYAETRDALTPGHAGEPRAATVPAFADLRRALILDACSGEGNEAGAGAGAGEAAADGDAGGKNKTEKGTQQVLHISYDDDDNPLAPPEPLGWRDCFPQRAHVLVPVRAAVPGKAADAPHPALGRGGGKRRLRVELLAARDGRIVGALMEGEKARRPRGGGFQDAESITAAGSAPASDPAPSADSAMEEIQERILRVFDPAGVLRP